MKHSAYINEVFSSLQGEGEFIGYRQVFIRTAGCAFDCPYCDTDMAANSTFEINGEQVANPIESGELVKLLIDKFGDGSLFHSYSFTGGEPLASSDFVFSVASMLKTQSKAKLFLETSGLMPQLIKASDGIFDILSVDIKTHSKEVLDNMPILFSALESLQKSQYYLKLVIDAKDDLDIILNTVSSNMAKFGIKKVIVQPVDGVISQKNVDKVFVGLYNCGIECRIIGQSHKMLNLR